MTRQRSFSNAVSVNKPIDCTGTVNTKKLLQAKNYYFFLSLSLSPKQ